MDRDVFLAMIEKLPKGTNIVVRGGAAASDDAWNPTVKVFASSGHLTAVVEADNFKREHYNYPEGYSGVKDVTSEYFPEVLKYEVTEEEKKMEKIAAIKAYRQRTGLDLAEAKCALEKHWYKR